MNLTLERAPALSALARVVGVVERRHTIPILSNVALRAEGGALHLRATDLDMEAIEAIPADVETDGEITIPADKLHDIVRNAEAGAQIALSMDATDPRVKVKSGRSRFQVPAMPSTAFPTFPTDGFDAGFTMPAKVLADMLSRVLPGVAPITTNSALACVFLGTVGDEIHAVGCSSQGLVFRREPRPEGAEIAAILPTKFVGQAVRRLAEADGEVRVRQTGTMIRIEQESSVLTSKLFDAPKYAPYLEVLLDTHEAFARTDQEGLAAAARRVLVMMDAKSNAIRLAFTSGGVSVLARNDQAGEGADELFAEYEGPDHSFLLNASRLMETLSALQGETVEIGFSLTGDPKHQDTFKTIIRAPSDPSFVAMLMQPRA